MVQPRQPRKCSAAMYCCKTHGNYRWNLPVGSTTSQANLVGDVIGQWIVHSCTWAWLWQIFRDTESYIALERQVRSAVQASLVAAAARHPSRESLSEEDRQSVHAALMGHIQDTPTYKVMKHWLLTHLTAVFTPADVCNLCVEVVASHGAVCNMDFSSSDGTLLAAQ